MAVLTSKSQAGGVVGDTYTDIVGTYQIAAVFADGNYLWLLLKPNMSTITYDTDGNSVIDLAEAIAGNPAPNEVYQTDASGVQMFAPLATTGLTYVGEVATKADMLALGDDVGQCAFVMESKQLMFQLRSPPSAIPNWIEIGKNSGATTWDNTADSTFDTTEVTFDKAA